MGTSKNIKTQMLVLLSCMLIPSIVSAQSATQNETATAPTPQKKQQKKHTKKTDEIRAAVQGICPVSGIELGKHGTPFKVKVAGEEIFLCCKACMKRKINAKHWATIHKNFAKAQGMCLVMDNKLSKKSKFTVVSGRIFYVCCPPCIAKIKKNPEKFAKELDDQYVRYLASLEKAKVKR